VGTLQQQLSEGKILPVYVLTGSEELMKREALQALEKAVLEDRPRAFNETRFRWKETSAEEVIAVCSTLSMMGGRRLVVVKDVDGLRGDPATALANYLEDPNPQCTLVLVATKVDLRLKLYKRVKKVGRVETFKPPYSNQLGRWVQDRARSKSVSIDGDAASLLGDIIGDRLTALDEALERLILYVATPEGPIRIRLEDVEACIARTRVHTVFELTDALGRRKTGDALQILDAMLGAREQPIRILAMVARHLRRLWQARDAMDSNESQETIGKTLNVHRAFLRDFLRQARMFSHAEFAVLLDRVYQTDRLLKSSRAPSAFHMHQLILDICVAG